MKNNKILTILLATSSVFFTTGCNNSSNSNSSSITSSSLPVTSSSQSSSSSSSSSSSTVTTYKVSIITPTSGAIISSVKEAPVAEKFTLTFTPNDDYKLISITINDVTYTDGFTKPFGKNTYTFETEMVEGGCTIDATFSKDGEAVKVNNYTISSLNEFESFRNDVNNGSNYEGVTFLLQEDIDLTDVIWTPIGTGTRDGKTYTGNPFKGIFDGNNHTITLNEVDDTLTCLGLFGIVDGGTIKNLSIKATLSASSCSNLGIVAAILTNDGLIDNVKTSGIVTGKDSVGGIVGRMLVSSTISNCANDATVNATNSNVGGIVGAAYYTEKNKEMNIIDCTNNGSITSTSGAYIGGIAGLSASNIHWCENTGNIVANGTSGGAGGIAGEQRYYGEVTNCKNSGSVTATNASAIAGGIVGWTRYPGDSTSYTNVEIIEVSNNENSGTIKAYMSAGGIIGLAYNSVVAKSNTNFASKIEATTFGAGIIGAIQTAETPATSIDQCNFIMKDNTSSTTIENITGNCTDLIVYTNGNEVKSE